MHMFIHTKILTDTTHMHTHYIHTLHLYIHFIHTYISARNWSVYRDGCRQHTSRGRTEFELTQHSFVLKVETVVLKVETVVFSFCLLQVLHIRTITWKRGETIVCIALATLSCVLDAWLYVRMSLSRTSSRRGRKLLAHGSFCLTSGYVHMCCKIQQGTEGTRRSEYERKAHARTSTCCSRSCIFISLFTRFFSSFSCTSPTHSCTFTHHPKS